MRRLNCEAQIVSGALLCRDFLASSDLSLPAIDSATARAASALARIVGELGPASPVGRLFDLFAVPLASLLGFALRDAIQANAGCLSASCVPSTDVGPVATLVVIPWGSPIDARRREAILESSRRSTRWCLITNVQQLHLVDAGRPHSQRWIGFDVQAAALDGLWLARMIAVTGRHAFDSEDGHTRLENAIARSDSRLRTVKGTLQRGVEAASARLTGALLGSSRRGGDAAAAFDEALTLIYRILFLLFAEARGLVPVWHPTYRDSYTIDALALSIQRGGAPVGTWDALKAIARLAHDGATAGDLVVTPFNGRLFSPTYTPRFARGPRNDSAAAAAVASLTISTAGTPPHTTRIPFGDLGVEQLGAVYERVLGLQPRANRARQVTLERSNARKASGSFYTPRAVTDFVVRRTLFPLTWHASAEQILSLRIVDPAMGSGAFLVSACRYLSEAYERALVRDGTVNEGELSDADRAGFRRLVAQRCLFGVDVNPMAVQLARLSLWLCTLAADKPLSFVDHRLRTGNTLVGARIEDVMRQPPGAGRRRAAPGLFEGDEARRDLADVAARRLRLALDPDDSIGSVRAKERALAEIDSDASPIARWRAAADLWCAGWFWEDRTPPDRREYGALLDVIRGDTQFAHASADRRICAAREIAARERFFHWELEFPEVFAGPAGPVEAAGGFDAVIGNPPWEMLRGDEGEAAERDAMRARARKLLRFSRESGVYQHQGTGHGNAYQLFLERALQIVRPGGRFGLVLPWGVAIDEGSAALRRQLLDRCMLDELIALDNRDAIFPIHRSVRFVLLTAKTTGSTPVVHARFGVRDLSDLDRFPDESGNGTAELSRTIIDQAGGALLPLPWCTSSDEVRVLELLLRAGPPLGASQGWHARFGRELNATDDRDVIWRDGSKGLAVVGGRQLQPFAVDLAATQLRIAHTDAIARIGPAVDRARLAYRDVASATNRQTLIAAILPAGVAATHTVFCLKTSLGMDEQLFLCAVLNSYVANFIARMRVSTHVTTSIVESLPVPVPPRGSAVFALAVSLARAVAREPSAAVERARLQAAIARLYGVDSPAFRRILGTFPLLGAGEREATLRAFSSAL